MHAHRNAMICGMKRIAVIGGGAAGLACAIVSGQAGASVRIYEMDERVGRRILATGNGRCNFSNANMAADVYRNAEFVAKVYGRVTPAAVRGFFADLGLLWAAEPDGRLLPRTGKASTVVDVLRARCALLGVEECCGAKVRELVPPAEAGGVWTLALADGRFERAEAVVVATGGQDPFAFLPEGIAATPFSPILGSLRTDTSHIRGLDGIRAKCKVTLVRHEQPDIVEEGELLFRKYGVSGICVFNLSRHIDDDCFIQIDLFPEYAWGELQALLEERGAALLARDPGATVGDLLRGMVLPQLGELACAFASTRTAAALAGYGADDYETLAVALKSYPLDVRGIAEPGQCQGRRGGVDVAAVTDDLESREHPGLFFAGEVLDVDGPCGGYNLHWAWASGMLAGAAAAEYAGQGAVSHAPACHPAGQGAVSHAPACHPERSAQREVEGSSPGVISRCMTDQGAYSR